MSLSYRGSREDVTDLLDVKRCRECPASRSQQSTRSPHRSRPASRNQMVLNVTATAWIHVDELRADRACGASACRVVAPVGQSRYLKGNISWYDALDCVVNDRSCSSLLMMMMRILWVCNKDAMLAASKRDTRESSALSESRES